MTELEISSLISNYVTSNQGVTDFPVGLKQIGDEVDTLRMRVIDDLDKNGLLKRPFLNYTQVIEFDGTTTAKTVKKDTSNVRYIDVPKVYILKNNKPAIAYIGSLSGDQHYRVVFGLQKEWHKADKWIGRGPTAVISEHTDVNGFRIKFVNASPNKARIVFLAENPSDLEPFGYNGDKRSNDGGSHYPMPNAPLDIIIGKTVESYLRTLYRLPVQGNQLVDAPKQVKETT